MAAPPHHGAAALAQAERGALCDLLLELGPQAPTLCEGWRAIDLAAHLVVRERSPAAVGLVVPGPPRRALDRAMARAAARPFEELVASIRSGPPPLTRPVDGAFNLSEYFIHHEDLRRGGGDTTPRPESDTASVEAALWRAMRLSARLATRTVRGAALDLATPDGQVLHARRAEVELVTVVGRPGEIALYLSGRRGAAHVELDGSPAAVAAVQAARLGA